MEDIVIKESKFGAWKVWAGVAVFIIIFLGGVWWLYSWWLSPWLKSANNLNQENVTVPGVVETDQDKDGLNLKEETKLGTSDNLRDSDNDGLDDKKEVELGTNPLKPDSDEDGYLDGMEVNTGHNPLKK
jgi:hypothetical protein